MKKLFATVLTLMLVFGLVSCGRNNPAAMKPVLLPVPELPEVTPIPEPMSYEEYFSEDQEIEIDGAEKYISTCVSGIFDYGTVLISKATNPDDVVYTLENSRGDTFFISRDHLYYIENNTIIFVDLLTGEEETVYTGVSLRSFPSVGNDVIFFIDGTSCVRLHLPSRTADVFYRSSRLKGVVVNNNTAAAVLSTDILLGDGSGETANDYILVYIPTMETEKISREDLDELKHANYSE